MDTGGFPPQDKVAGLWSWPVTSIRVDVKNELSCTSTLPYAFIVWTETPLPFIKKVVIYSVDEFLELQTTDKVAQCEGLT